jgi:hypothetical protein
MVIALPLAKRKRKNVPRSGFGLRSSWKDIGVIMDPDPQGYTDSLEFIESEKRLLKIMKFILGK